MPPRRTSKSQQAASFDVENWAATQRPQTGGRQCGTCKNEPVSKAIAKVIEMRKRGHTLATDADIARMVQEHFGYDVSPSSITRHIRRCLGGKQKS